MDIIPWLIIVSKMTWGVVAANTPIGMVMHDMTRARPNEGLTTNGAQLR